MACCVLALGLFHELPAVGQLCSTVLFDAESMGRRQLEATYAPLLELIDHAVPADAPVRLVTSYEPLYAWLRFALYPRHVSVGNGVFAEHARGTPSAPGEQRSAQASFVVVDLDLPLQGRRQSAGDWLAYLSRTLQPASVRACAAPVAGVAVFEVEHVAGG